MSLVSPSLAGGFFTTSATWEAPNKKRDEPVLILKMSPFLKKIQTFPEKKRSYLAITDPAVIFGKTSEN